MRSIFWVAVACVVCGLISPAAAREPVWAGPMMPAGPAVWSGLSAPACGASLTPMGPSCGECSRTCCANVWDGYCQGRGCGLRRTVCSQPQAPLCQAEAPCSEPAAPAPTACCKLFELFQWYQTADDNTSERSPQRVAGVIWGRPASPLSHEP
jgi:hypothetical protein